MKPLIHQSFFTAVVSGANFPLCTVGLMPSRREWQWLVRREGNSCGTHSVGDPAL
jgi:hypothetical protein